MLTEAEERAFQAQLADSGLPVPEAELDRLRAQYQQVQQHKAVVEQAAPLVQFQEPGFRFDPEAG